MKDKSFSIHFVLIVIVGIAILLRIFQLGSNDLWADELHSYQISKEPLSKYPVIFSERTAPYPPLYF